MLFGAELSTTNWWTGMSQVSQLKLPDVHVDASMMAMADELEQLARDIRAGKTRACAYCIVESGHEMNVTSSWALMSGCCTLLGGLQKLLAGIIRG